MIRILIVEDNLFTARAYETKLQMEGFLADVANDGEAALQMIRQSPPDLALLDLMLPKVSGLQVLRTLRAQPEFQKLPIIVSLRHSPPCPFKRRARRVQTKCC